MAITKPMLPPKAGYVEVEVGGVRTYLDVRDTKIVTGSYVGTGTYGASNPNSLTFEFEPKLVVVKRKEKDSREFIAVYGVAAIYSSQTDTSNRNDLSWAGNTIRWFSSASTNAQMNASGATYYYIAIG